METMKNVLRFLNELGFTDNMNDDQIEKLRCIKQRLVFEFEDYNVSKLIYALDIIDEPNILNMVNILNARLEKTNCLREVIFYLISLKHFVDTDEFVSEH